ncbi:helix-turn-helix protein [Motilibacter rhizosphaerae]|uniref:Helix-turn-helix protein n=1 Tax=Motilibacter rhizosphaerae TaxID=598652 RepID=A0A4Q7NX47_9ACTN|nr:helix-turn-helix transcriptional regulator [Motilibacter rhizosphaerae]RZS91488.1 helix-turn-helix protein [Motilibacter rhizosphaerae]
MTAAPGIRRAELSGFLRARREGVTPAEVGLPAGARRRTPGLRREELAQLAGVGVTWYTWLEQGRPINVSTQVLDAVARVLRLDPAEHEHLYRLAGLPSVTMRGERRPEIPQHVRHVLDALGTTPATLLNSRYDVLAVNAAQARLVNGFHTIPCGHYNLLWCCFTEPTIRERLLDWDSEGPQMVATFRSAYVENLDDPSWAEFVERLSAASPEFATLWRRHEVRGPGFRSKTFDHPVVGRMAFVTTSLSVAEMPGCRIVAYTPADDECRAALERLKVLLPAQTDGASGAS